jgi:hypothetical protein
MPRLADGWYGPYGDEDITMYYPQPQVVRVAPIKDKSLGVAYLLWFLLGLIGGPQYYLGKFGRGVFYTLTLGGFVFGWLIDAFTLPGQVARVRARGY